MKMYVFKINLILIYFSENRPNYILILTNGSKCYEIPNISDICARLQIQALQVDRLTCAPCNLSHISSLPCCTYILRAWIKHCVVGRGKTIIKYSKWISDILSK